VARIWTEPYRADRHAAPIEYWGFVDAHLRTPTLVPKAVLMVNVVSFTFQFVSGEQLRDCLRYFELKIHPTSRRPIPGNIDHWEAQRWFERLPMYLLEDAKRKKVVTALRRALKFAEAPGFFETCS
jgi:hypothetical protein